MRLRPLRLATVVVAALALAAGHAGCERVFRNIGGLKRKKDRAEIGGEGLMGRLGVPASRAEAAREIGRRRLAEALPSLHGYLEDKDPNVRAACAWAIGEIGDANSIPAVRVLLTDHDANVRVAAARAIGKLPGAGAVLWLGESATKDTVAEVRAASARALGSIRLDSAAPWLARTLDDANAPVRAAAAEALAGMGSSSARDGLVRAMVHDDPAVRRIAQAAARRIGKPILPKLHAALNERVPADVRTEIARLLGRMGGPETASPMLRLLDGPPGRRRGGAGGDMEALRGIVVEALSAMGEPVLDAIRAETLDGEMGPLAEQAAREVCVRLGRPAVRTITDAVQRWRIFPDPQELKAWVGVLGDIGDPAGAAAFPRALAQDIDGMESVVADARRKIEATSGVRLAEPQPEAGLLFGPPGPLGHARVARAPLVLGPGRPVGGAVPDNGVVHLVLRGAMIRPNSGARQDLQADLVRRDGKWEQRFWGVCPQYNKRDHEGRIVNQRREGDGLVFDVEVVYHRDIWVDGGFGTYQVRVAPGRDRLTGTYRGQFNYRDVSGQVEGACFGHDWPKAAAAPLEPNEHPRLLFRRGDLPLLRDRARTDIGRRLLDALRARLAAQKQLYRTPLNWVTNWEPGIDDVIGHAFLAVLFDDAPHARRVTAEFLDRTLTPPYGGEHGERIPGPIFHYPYAADLMYDFLDPNQQAEVFLTCRRRYIMFQVEMGPVGITAVGRGLLGLPGNHALVVLGSRGEFQYPAPAAPPPVISLDAEAPPPRKLVPVNTLQLGKMPASWLIAGPFAPGRDDPLAGIGGRAAARPQKGTLVEHNAAQVPFVPLPGGAVEAIPGLFESRSCLVAPGGTAAARWYLYALLDVPRPSGCALSLGHDMFGEGSSRVWIDGRALRDGAVLLLGAGLHRVMAEVHGRLFSPYFLPADADFTRAQNDKYARVAEQYRAARRRHERTGVIQDIPAIIERAAVSARVGMTGTIEAARDGRRFGQEEFNLPFASALWTATGYGLEPDTPFLLSARPDVVAVMGPRHLAFAMGMAPEPLKRTIVARFDRDFLHSPAALARMSCVELIAAFVNYPMDPAAPTR